MLRSVRESSYKELIPFLIIQEKQNSGKRTDMVFSQKALNVVVLDSFFSFFWGLEM